MKRLAIAAAFVGLCVAAWAAQPEDNPSRDRILSLQFAQANLNLAQIELQIALEDNRKVAGTVPDILIERLRMNVTVAAAQVEQALGPSTPGAMNVHLRYAEERARVARLDFQKAEAARKKQPESITDLQFERLRLEANVASLRLAIWRNPIFLPSLLDQMQWQIDRLGDEIIELHKRVDRAEFMPKAPGT